MLRSGADDESSSHERNLKITSICIKLQDFSTRPQSSPPDMLDVQPDLEIHHAAYTCSTVDLERVSSITTSQKKFGSH
jgi:hypothetical protein